MISMFLILEFNIVAMLILKLTGSSGFAMLVIYLTLAINILAIIFFKTNKSGYGVKNNKYICKKCLKQLLEINFPNEKIDFILDELENKNIKK